MTDYMRRADWTTHARPDDLTRLDPADVIGLAVHWPGTTAYTVTASRDGVAEYLDGIRADHVNRRGWDDIAYQYAVDQAGRVWPLRGFTYRSAANGDTGPNSKYGAILLLIGRKQRPSAEMINAVNDLRARWLEVYPHAVKVVTHNDVRPEATECPGPYATAMVRNGTFTRGTTLNADQIRDVLDTDGVLRNVTGTVSTNKTVSLATMLERTWANTERIPGMDPQLDRIERALSTIGIALSTIGSKLAALDSKVTALGASTGADPAALADRIVTEMLARVAEIVGKAAGE